MMLTEKVAGRIPVLECLKAGKRKPHRLYVLEGAPGLDEIQRAAPGVPVVSMPRRELDQILPGAVHQGVILEADPLPVLKFESWLDHDHPSDAIVVVLDGVEDPRNFGAIVRSAAATGAQAVMFAKDRAAPISPVSVKSAAGAMEYLDLVQATNLARALDAMKEKGFWIAELDEAAPQTIWDADLSGRIALVIGSEGKGVRRLVSEHCDLHLRIPLTGPITSLNASVSAAIALAECLRQRLK
ncbi:MAG: 23S rRNA (guanosine(2251)-2'-O)-methyltransferase RlmB [Candidatus Hydrogenedentes bacterium]|nr:23S rRNA (guanosine(2251)-2'-O)-methyltransferase RlmB [Candidatus Hydrogenedentota bacterium]